MSYVSVAETVAKKSNEIFEALDMGEAAVDYFKEKCEELPRKTLLQLRDKRVGNEGKSLLHIAARGGVLPAVLYLVNIGHPIDVFDSSLTRKTALMDAIEAKNTEIAIVLVESGAELSKVDINNENAYHYAARSNSSRIIKWMTKAANLQPLEIQQCTGATSIKLKFPEDLTESYLCQEILTNYRTKGKHESSMRNAERMRNTSTSKAIASL